MHSSVRLSDRSNIAEARRAAKAHAEGLGWSGEACGDAEIVASELATNLVKHAREGAISLTSRLAGERGTLLLVSVDRGPGMGDVYRCLEDGYSTSGSPGTGLGAVRRLAEMDIATAANGTVIVAELARAAAAAKGGRVARAGVAAGRRPAAFRAGAFALQKEGQVVNGDAWACLEIGGSLAVLVCDGLGHGSLAAEASSRAVRCFLDKGWQTPQEALARMDEALRPTRGAAAAVCLVDPAARQARYCGVGNVVAGIAAGSCSRHLVSQAGILGGGVRRLSEFEYEWLPDATLIMHSDGISGRWQPEQFTDLRGRHPALVAGCLYRDLTRGFDDVVVVAVTGDASAA